MIGTTVPRRFDEDVLKLRLTRMGAKGRPHYRIVVQEARSKRDGRFVENLGHYNPLTEPSTIVVNADRVRYWLSVGAQPTDSVASLLKRAGVETGKNGAATTAATTATEA
jgi:small subunit ribosomal protein S16